MTQRPSHEELARARRALVAARLRGGGAPATTTARRVDLDRVPLSPAQERLWLHDQLHPGSTAYTICDAIRIDGPLDASELGAAAEEVAARHESLRMTFHSDGGVPYATVHARLVPEVTRHAGEPPVEEIQRRPFDLARGPLLRLDIVETGPDQHVLVLSLHHIVGDGWSMGLLVRELTTVYLRRRGRPAPELAVLTEQYPDVVVHQRELRDTPGYQKQLDYWRERLADADPAPTRTDQAGATTPVRFGPDLVRILRETCQAHQITPFMVLLAAFGTVLAARTGSARPVIGTPVAGRSRPEVEPLIGYFTNTLPLSLDTTGEPTAAELWARAKTATLGGLANADVSLGEISDVVRGPVFQALLALQNYPFEPIHLDELTITPVQLVKHEAKVDLSLYLYERDGGIEGYLEHRLSVVDAAAATRFVADLVRAVEAMVATPDAALDLVGADERARLLTDRVGPTPPRPSVLVHQLVESTVDRMPDAVAVVDPDGTTLTYAELDREANRLAHWLLAGGLRPEEPIGLLLPRGTRLVTAMLGVLKAGGAFVPVDPDYPAHRIDAMTEGARVVLSNWPDLDDQPADRPSVTIPRAGLAYVIYTSGSTGRPKGIGAEHAGVVNHNLSAVEVFGLTSADRVLHFSSPSFDASIEEILPALAVGATVVARSADLVTSFHKLDEFVRDHAITVLGLPTALWERWHHHLRETGVGVPPSVRLVTLSGQRVNAESVRRWATEPATAGIELINTYGPTEATVTTSTYSVAGAAPSTGEIPIGTPWPHYRTYVVDERLRLVPDGAVGELCVGGAGVSRGYLDRPELTAASFVPDPFGPPGARMYRTGDQVRWRLDGTLEFVARLDGQVKVRGNRVEPGEVESVLATHPSVAQCAVIAYTDRDETVLGAHVVLRDEVELTSLSAHLAARLPAYMVPSGFARHDTLPLTPNGKVDRRALPAPSPQTADYRAPAGRWEEALAALWCDVLDVERVGRDDDFFALGGNSLTAMVLSSRIEHDLGRTVSLGTVFGNSTLTALAGELADATESTVDPITPAPDAEHHPTSSGQRRIFLLQEASGSGTSYNMPLALEVHGPADPAYFGDLLRRLVNRHEALRTTFAIVDGEVRQRIRTNTRLELPVHDITPSEVDAALADLVQPFDLGTDVLLRAHWLRLADEHGVLFLDIHHIAADGTSLEVLVEEFLSMVDGAELAPVPVRYKDFAHWQARRADRSSEHAAYWRDVLRDPPELTFPYDHPRPARQTFDGFTTEFTIPSDTVTALTQLAAAAAGATTNIALLAVYGAVLSRYAGQSEVTVGSLVPGRNHPDLARAVGMFANFLPVRLAVSADDTFTSLLACSRERVLADYEHQDLPFEEIVSLASRPPSPGRNPLFDTMLIFHGGRALTVPSRHAGLSFTHRPITHGTAKLDLKLDVFPRQDGALTVQVEANRALLQPESVADLVRHFESACKAAVSTPDSPLNHWLTDDEAAALAEKRRRLAEGDLTLTIAATFTAEPLTDHVRWWCRQFGLDVRVEHTGFDQVFQALLDPDSPLNTGTGPKLLLVRFEDWAGADLSRTYEDLLAAVMGKRLLVGVLPATDPMRSLTARWRQDVAALPGITIVDLEEPITRYGVQEWSDPAAYELGRVPFTEGWFAAAGTTVARCLVSRYTPPFKVLAVDADNTLWHGVAGEDGPLGVEASVAVQQLLLRKREEGMLLALVSKNIERDVWSVFEQNPEMLLKRTDFAAHRVNWQPKSTNLVDLAAELNLGVDSIVFLDDSPAECAEVRAALPEVLTLQLPADRTEHAKFLSHVWALDAADLTEDDRQRANRYAAEQKRTESASKAATVTDFLSGLGLTASLRAVSGPELERAAQLTLRTNQFNISGRRWRRAELEAHLTDPKRRCHVLEVRDRFGDHGLVGAVVTTQVGEELRVDNVVLSCRVLGRTVEEAVLAGLRKLSTELGTTRVTVQFHRTDRNEPAAAFLQDYGWHKTEAPTTWELPHTELPEHPKHVRLTYGTPLPTIPTSEPAIHTPNPQHPKMSAPAGSVKTGGPPGDTKGTFARAEQTNPPETGVNGPELSVPTTTLDSGGPEAALIPLSEAVRANGPFMQADRPALSVLPGRLDSGGPEAAHSQATHPEATHPEAASPAGEAIGGEPVSQAVGNAAVSQAIGREPVSQAIRGELVSQAVGNAAVSSTAVDEAWTPYRLDHVGVAVRDVPAAIRRFEALGFTASPIVDDPRQRSTLVMLERPGHHCVEFVGALGSDSPTAALLDRGGDRPYHLCFQVRAIPDALADWAAAGVRFVPVSDSEPAVLFGGRRVQFFHVTGVGLIELVEIGGATGPDLAPPAAAASTDPITVQVTDIVAARKFFALLGHTSLTLIEADTTELLLDVPGTEYWLADDERLVHRAHLIPLRHTTEAALRALPVRERAHGRHVAPRNDTERLVVTVFAELLDATGVGITDSWFALGGHSLKAVALLSRLHNETGVMLSLQDLFDNNTPATLAALLCTRDRTVLTDLAPAKPDMILPLSSAQSRFVVAHHLHPDSTDHNLTHAMALRGTPDLDRMRTALAQLVARHETLRTGFQLVGGEIAQVVHDEATIAIETGVATGAIEEEVRKFVRPFDLARAPLMRLAVLRRADDHLLLVDVHHIVADGVSIALLVEDFLALYTGVELPETRQFRDWVAYERQLPATEEYQRAERYWLDRFADTPPALDLPADHQRPAVQGTEGGNVRFHADNDLVAGLRRTAEQAGATLFMTVLAALYVTLWRHTRQTDLVIGSPTAGRTHPDVARTVGPFFNVLPLRVGLDPAATFTTFLDQVRDVVLGGVDNQVYPFEQLVDRLDLERDTSRNPLFDVMVSFQEQHLGEVEGELSVRSLDLDTGRSLFDLELFAHPVDDGFTFNLTFASSLFHPDTATRFADRFQAALRAVARNPRRALHQLDLLDPTERAELVAGLGTRTLDVPAGDTVVARIERHATQHPNRVAVVCGDERRTYAELVAGGRRVANLLREHGVRREEVVGVLLDRGILLAECVLGVWQAGAAYLPLDPRHPAARRHGVLADANSRFVLTTDPTDEFPGELIDPTTTPADTTTSDPIQPHQLAYTLFTSGSTGRPKGAMVEHLGMLNHMLAKVDDLGLDEHTVLAQNASQCFDISIWQLFGALVTGGRTVICPDEVAADPRALLATVASEAVTTLEVVPSLLEVMLDLPGDIAPLAGLRQLLVTGEAVPKPLVDRWFRTFPDVPVINAYGPTEASDDITHHVLRAAPTGMSVPIGRPIPNARIYVVDDTVPLDAPGAAALSPRGVTGEICVAGPCVGRGYVNDEERTAAVFRPDPFVGGRLYRTGDIGRWLPDGTLEFLGRKDDQVKVRGHRIELGEVEAALARCPDVTASAAAVRDQLLVGYVVGADADATREHLAATLPAYLVPDAVVVLDRLPLTSNGKTNRKALPSPSAAAAPVRQVEPLVSGLEHEVAALFAETLGVEVTDAAADFFALGGHSLKAVLLLAVVQERHGVLVPLSDVFRDPTVRGLAAAIARQQIAAGPEDPVTRLGPARDQAVFAFPPIAGWGLVYLPFAEALPDHEVHAFDFVPDEHRVKQYADLVEERRPDGSLTLMGYSAGGNLAFEVAVELESRGRRVRELVMYDVLYRDELTEESAEHIAARVREDMAEGMQALDPRLQEALSAGTLQAMAAQKREAYVAYWNGLRHEHTVAADIVLVRAEDTDLDETATAAWRRATTGKVTVTDGDGRHREMMSGHHAPANARHVA